MESLKSTANELYKEGKFPLALETYEKCQNLSPSKDESLILSKNKVACLVKMENYSQAIDQCQIILDNFPHDVKTLYRFAFSLNKIGRHEDSAANLKILLKIDGGNKLILDLMNEVMAFISKKDQNNIVSVDKLETIVGMMKDSSTDDSELIKNIKRLHYLGSCAQKCAKIVISGGVDVLFSFLLSSNYTDEIRVTSCHCLKDLALKSEQIAQKTFDWMMEHVKLLLKVNISTDLLESIWALCDSLIIGLKSPTSTTKFIKMAIQYIDSNRLGAFSRNRLLLFLIKHLKDFPTFEFVDQTEVVDKVLTLLGVKTTNNLVLINQNTLNFVKSLLSTLYDGLGNEKQTKTFQKKCRDYINSFLITINDLDASHIASVDIISALLQSVPDVASELLSSKENLVTIILMLIDADQDPSVRELVSVLDCLIGCISIRKLALAHSESIFLCFQKHFLSSTSDSVRIRALVGLSKAISIEGFSNSLSEDIKDILKTSKITRSVLDVLSGRGHFDDDKDLFNYAVHAMLFLSMSADSKELMCNDKGALGVILESSGDQSAYAISQILVNVTNSYDQVETDENLKKLAEFAKEKIPKKDPKDSDEYIKDRVIKLIEGNVFKSLRTLALAKSSKARENVSRVFLAVLRYEKNRGLCAQKGCIKTLLDLSKEFCFAGHALARIGITSNPVIIFPDQMMFQIVCPFVQLLCISKTPLQNFEGLLALGNLASVNDDVRRCIMHNKGFQAVETCMFSDDPRIRLAAVQCMCNMALLEDVLTLYTTPGNDRIKMLVIFTGFLEEEECDDLTLDLVSAASGTLGILSGDDEICRLICTVSHWEERLMSALTANKDSITHRVLHILRNICYYGSASLSSELAQLVRVFSAVNTSTAVTECALDIVKLID